MTRVHRCGGAVRAFVGPTATFLKLRRWCRDGISLGRKTKCDINLEAPPDGGASKLTGRLGESQMKIVYKSLASAVKVMQYAGQCQSKVNQ